MPLDTPVTGFSEARLPTYEELQAERDLKSQFAQLAKDHDEIQRLFKSVAGQLATTPKIGEDHELCAEWDALYKRHRKLYRDSQLNASQCASFLNNYGTVLVPLSRGQMSSEEKRIMISKFVETIPIHQEAAKRTSTRFHELGKQVEVFPMKVSSYLRQEADKGSWLTALWSGVEDLCMSIWTALNALFSAIIRLFNAMLSHVGAIRLSCGPFLRLEVQLAEPRSLPLEDAPRSTFREVKRDIKEIGDRLCGFEDAWHMIRLACSNLLENVEMASRVSGIPDAFSSQLKPAEVVYYPLVVCLRAYAAGKSPLEE
ncbi:hypothetical protein PHLGIDRAFT_35691 [Phlebiopsis gigantea 11061_1 CR5-6]|uniref:Uncharacterized protein n=1 Tax=Phlebiopsis gigantea (strain 11061_1 CR5-6) TaxID=745531 RepID=A0A0C3NPF1_PHLG1|nr:hypothetical protein PHLGIDRAFT_35691 [Phlebiopsis gigantea 11061_1 CR5-6]